MEKIEVIFKFMKNLMWAFILEGLLSIILGILVIYYPYLLNVLVAILFIAWGVIALYLAIKISKYTKIKIKV